MSRPAPDPVILGLLKAQPSHGYELLEYFKATAQLGHSWTMSTSQLYAVLKRLERKGAIIGHEIAMQNAPPRFEYEITPEGTRLLETWLFDPVPSASIHQIRVFFLSRIYIANLLLYPIQGIVDAQIASCQQQRDQFIVQKQTSHSESEKLTLDYVINQLATAIDWLETNQFDFLTKN